MLRGAAALLLALSMGPLASGIKMNAVNRKIATEASVLESYSFSDFVKEHGREYLPDSEEWQKREKLFEASKLKIIEHNVNKGPERSWSKGFNKFADWTEEEYKKLMGYKAGKKAIRMQLNRKAPEEVTDGSHPIESDIDLHMDLPDGHNNLDHLPLSASYIRDQGACGSCWAVSSATVLEAHLEKTATVMAQLPAHEKFEDIALSSQAITSCTPNPNKCGGAGGCEGATAELAFELVKAEGIPMAKDYMYFSGSGDSGTCNHEKLAASTISIDDFVKLPSNKYQHLLQALYQKGPAVVSVAAGEWSLYQSGIFAPDEPDYVVNHAVACMGFGHEDGKKYWLIQNSWGKEWGESGKIRLLRSDNEEEQCGWDMHPDEGTGCDGGPAKVWVCGNSGILFDSSYPVGVHIK